MALWSFLEALVWPIIPDFLLAALVIGRPKLAGSALIACIGGSAIGTAILYRATLARPADVMRLLRRLPFVFEADIESVAGRIERQGATAFVWQPISGIPSKVWAVVGAAKGLRTRDVLPILTASRAVRMALIAILAELVGSRFSSSIRERFLLLLAFYTSVFVIGWARSMHRG
jgi:1-acyl-sn-glycerol-3-phosphate acyltransferase